MRNPLLKPGVRPGFQQKIKKKRVRRRATLLDSRCPTRESTKPKTQARPAGRAILCASNALMKRPSHHETVFSISSLSPLLPHPNPFPIRNPFLLSKPTFSCALSTQNHNIPHPLFLYFFITSALKQLQAYPLNDAINCARIEPRGVISAEGVTNNERKRKV